VPTQEALETKELSYWLALLNAPGLGPIKFFKLLDNFPRLPELFEAPKHQLNQMGLDPLLVRAIKNPNWSPVEKALRWAENDNNHLLSWQDPAYPRLLKEIPAPPPLLYVHGQVSSLATPQLAMVGSRNPTPAGRETALAFASELSRHGLTITSGLALGIDTAGHEGALKASGKTIAILGTGLDQIYPARNRDLAIQISQQGALISEFPLETQAKPANFPRRNRIISGLSTGVLVVEAALKSGSLITAHYAIEQGREVLVIPGSIHNPLARGCHRLIKEGAKLVETSNDILEELGPLISSNRTQDIPHFSASSKIKLDNEHTKLVNCVGYEATPIDTLIERSGFDVDTVTSMLVVLELSGVIRSVPGGYARKH